MVSADNLNLDVLELIFAFLSGNDLASVASVSRSFLAGVIPRLYQTISYRMRHGKGYGEGQTMSPFASILAHRHLAVHVRNIELRTVPTIKSQCHPAFVRECAEAIRICKNLKLFKCTVPNVLPTFLPSLKEKSHLEDLTVHANLTSDQAKMLLKLGNLQSLTVNFATWNVVDVLPSWTESLSGTLTSLTLYVMLVFFFTKRHALIRLQMISELNEGVLKSVLTHLPGLTGLHIVGCTKVDHVVVLHLASHTPLLESLSLTTSESTRELIFPPSPLRHLRNLAVDTRCSATPSPSPAILIAILAYLKFSSSVLLSFTMRLPERKAVVDETFITRLLENHAHSLRRLSFLDCGVSQKSITEICKACLHLERLDVAIPSKDLMMFASNLSKSTSLKTLMEVDRHVEHGVRQSIGRIDAHYMFSKCLSLRKIITNQRIWNVRVLLVSYLFLHLPYLLQCQRPAKDLIYVDFERRRSHTYGSLWFIPRE
ncbi:hypothetical protein B0H34DRAFT_754140 [Crassisporium funariophilum]|nr:hypothetical protein B0H34DRAFT_754140 [Crassisporium funariophilum]